ncbi:MAG TPA: RDD family protein [Chitinophagaceae bacterium]|nr:RDD family protein [Chitinophagaceae bacterium]
MEQVINQPIATTRYASFWIRCAAYLIDLIIAGAVASILSRLFFGNYFNSYYEPGNDPAASGVSLIVNWLYFAYQESSEKQATIGKLAVGIRVCSETGSRVTFANATGRFFAKFLSVIILFFGFIMVAFDDKKQGLHDKLAKTFVVYIPA